MKLAIMQPYFLPYIGYFQLMNAVDEFVIYDNIEFTKKGWINRNRILVNGTDSYITLPLQKDSDYLNVRDRCLAAIWRTEKKKMLNRITQSYKKSPYFDDVYPMVEKVILFEDHNLFGFILNSLDSIREYLEIRTRFIVSSTIPIDHTLKAERKVIEICRARRASTYINPIGGVKLYANDNFKEEGLGLNFLRTDNIKYKQFSNAFIPSLSMVDVMMFNSKEDITKMLGMYTLE
jgi:hypothetical protein